MSWFPAVLDRIGYAGSGTKASPPAPTKVSGDNCEANPKDHDEPGIDWLVGKQCLPDVCNKPEYKERGEQ
ncbi:hypothetical protein [Rubripirellula tenax]|uniref:hypothetical protein n=1 Tax=Rubripirellula tenax TaxID=2528015 RepID=UPI0011B5C0F5|nr:hypothetical protein [Rubripirellula tenax]